MIHDTFEQFMAAEILPKRKANPTGVRLDGDYTAGNRLVIGRFRYRSKVWRVNADTHYEPLIIAHEAITKNRSFKPFVEESTQKGRSLVLTPSLRKMASSKFKHLYIYKEKRAARRKGRPF